MLVLAIADKLLDIIGLLTVIYFAVKGTWWLAHRKTRDKTKAR